MLKKIKDKLKNINWFGILIVILAVIGIICALSTIILYIWAFMTYKDTPISEIPGWIIWILMR